MKKMYNNSMENLKIKKAFSDDALTFDKVNQKYELSLAYTINLVGNVFKDTGEMVRRIKLNSMVVYNYIYNHGNTNNKKYTRFILNNTEQGRAFIKECLESQMIADAKNGYNDLGSENLVDIANNNAIKRETIRENLVSVNTEELIVNSKADLCGYNVLNPMAYYLPELEKELEE